MLHRGGGVLALVALLVPATAFAVVPGQHDGRDDDALVTTERAGVKQPPRRHIETRTGAPLRAAAWDRLVATGGRWHATWDVATKVPSRIWGTGIPAPGSVASPEVAAAWARATLAAHIDLLAPGSRVSDFTVVSNLVIGDQRVVGLAQHHAGLRVVGGQISIRFKNDRLFVIGSEAAPDVRIATTRVRLSAAERSQVAGRARDATVDDLGLRSARVASSGDPVILPLIGDAAVLGYRVVVPVDVDAGTEGRWTVYAAPGGEPLARSSRRQHATGTLYYNGITRYPGTPRFRAPARHARITVNGQAMTASDTGVVTWSPDATAAVVAGAVGETVVVVNKSGAAAATELTLAPGADALWAADDEVLVDAQIQAYVHTLIVKDYVRNHIADLEFLDLPLLVNVNHDDECNAYYDGESLNFFRSSDRCQNTALVADVVYHEFGHALHHAVVVEGVGRMDGALSEGMADFLAASITGDPGMGRGFFRNDDALRHIDEPFNEALWPRDVGEIHSTGVIFAGAMWDLRKALISQLGDSDGIALANRLFLAAIRTSTSIPSSLIEILAADDDDGDLDNGTPHECSIKSAFALHGLHTTVGTVGAVGAVRQGDLLTTPIQLTLGGLSPSCPDDQVTGVELMWRPRAAGSVASGVAPMVLADGAWSAALPLPPDSNVLQYAATVTFAGGAQISFPDNRAAPWYELYRGQTTELYCTDFETDPFAAGWTSGGDPLDADIWEWGPPLGGSAGDPAAAFSGGSVIGTNLSDDDGGYGHEGVQRTMWLRLPPIDLGQWSDVRLQYWRWLTVEDGYFDQASVVVDDELAWQNYNSSLGDSSSIHHQDLQWAFHDVPVTARVRDRFANIEFRLETDRGLAFGGWNIDSVCVVANIHSVCGDGRISGGEQCDDGAENADLADTCRSICRVPACGDTILDYGEQCDDGNRADGDTCTPRCLHSGFDDQCECSGRRTHPVSMIPVAIAALVLLRRRRPRA